MPTLAATEPYPWPYDGDLSGLALVVAGAQVGWAARSLRVAEVTAVLCAVAAAVQRAGGMVVALRHGSLSSHPSSLPPFVGGDDWRALPIGDAVVVDCVGCDGFYGGSLDDVLRARGVDHLVIGGFGYEAAVDSTLRSANDRGYECLVLSDGVAPFDESLCAHALDSVTMSGGIFGAVGTSSDLMEVLS